MYYINHLKFYQKQRKFGKPTEKHLAQKLKIMDLISALIEMEKCKLQPQHHEEKVCFLYSTNHYNIILFLYYIDNLKFNQIHEAVDGKNCNE